MELNKKILKYGLVLITLSLVFSIGFSLIYKLKTPVFLKMYVERPMTDYPDLNLVENFELKYITDVSDKRRIIDIEFKEEPNLEVLVADRPSGGGFSPFNNHNFNNPQEDIYGRYIIKPIYLRMELIDIDKDFFEVELNNAKITFSDGSTLDTDLGLIVLYKDERRIEDTGSKSTFSFISVSSSSDGTSTSRLEVNEDINLIELKSPILDNVKDYIELSIDDIDYSQISEIEYEKGKALNAYSKFETPEDVVNKYTVYDMKPKLYYKKEDGQTSYTRIYNIDYTPYSFDLIEVFKYLKTRGAI